MTEQTTPDPKGTGAQTDQQLQARIAELEAITKTSTDDLTKQKAEIEKRDLTIRRLQADRDRKSARLDRLTQARAPASTSVPGAPRAVQSSSELQEFANEKAREAMLLRALMDSGLKEDDLDAGIEFNTPAELQAAVNITLLNKKIVEQDQQLQQMREAQVHLEGSGVEVLPPFVPPVDTGGPTGVAPDTEGLNTPETLRARAKELRAVGTPDALRQARWLILHASHADPAKVIGRGRGGPTQDG